MNDEPFAFSCLYIGIWFHNWILHFSLKGMELLCDSFFKGKVKVLCNYVVKAILWNIWLERNHIRISRDFLWCGEVDYFARLDIIVLVELLWMVKLKLYSLMVIASYWEGD